LSDDHHKAKFKSVRLADPRRYDSDHCAVCFSLLRCISPKATQEIPKRTSELPQKTGQRTIHSSRLPTRGSTADNGKRRKIKYIDSTNRGRKQRTFTHTGLGIHYELESNRSTGSSETTRYLGTRNSIARSQQQHSEKHNARQESTHHEGQGRNQIDVKTERYLWSLEQNKNMV
jgi:hypothetical protein